MSDRVPSPRPRPVPAPPGRRRVLGAAAVGGLALLGTACGPLRLGQPERYTPPPPGIDDLYRPDLLAALDAARTTCAAAADLREAQPELVDALLAALDEQRRALLTGAEASASPDATAAPSDGGGAVADAQTAVAALVAQRDLCVQAARQVSAPLARPVAGIGAWAAWASARVAALLPAAAASLTALPGPEQILATRTVPETDPPTVGASSDYHSTIETAQVDEWYTGYVREVLAARSEGSERERHLGACALHRTRAEQLAAIAAEDGAPVAVREAVYPLPPALADPAGAALWPGQASQDLLVTHLALVGAAPFERRPLPIAAALAEATALAAEVAGLAALPSLGEEE